jgi:rubrerythrin
MPVFSASEVVQLGIEIERNGRDYYRAVAAASKDARAKEIFSFLAGEEERHEKVFEGMLAHIEKYEPPEAYAVEYFEYLKALSKDHVFTSKGSGKKAAALIKNDTQAVGLAIGFEKDSILLFTEMKKLVSADGQKMVDKLIQQEQEHLLRLTQLKQDEAGL